MTPRASYATCCGILGFLGTVLLGGLIMWEMDPGQWPHMIRFLIFYCATMVGGFAAVVAYNCPNEYVLKAEKKEAAND